jgi:RND family efflux transporter MFP subunit
LTAPRAATVPVAIAVGVAVLLGAGAALVRRAESRTNDVALAASPKPVTVVAARAEGYRETRTYVGTLRPWIEASVGPQLVSAYVDTVLVRPGAKVKRGDVLATLDCRNTSAANQAVAAEARAIESRQQAYAHESARVQSLLDGGFVSPNEAEQKQAQSAAEEAQLTAQQAKMASTRLEVSDCVLRAPFDGEVATRAMDPGSFVRPGAAIVSVVDRSTVRMTFDVPEVDFEAVPPETPVSVQIVATGKTLAAAVSRRAPSADPETRTVHVEVDLVDPERAIPVDTTGEARLAVGRVTPGTVLPLTAATVNGAQATVFVVDGDVARRRTVEVLGEQGRFLFVRTSSLPAGALVVTEGRGTLVEGDRVRAVRATGDEGPAMEGPGPAPDQGAP